MTHSATLPRAGPRRKLVCRYSKRSRDRDSYQRHRSGNINPLLYRLYQIAPQFYFHDVTSVGHIATNNGLFPAVRGYDLATGIGTIRMTPLITGF